MITSQWFWIRWIIQCSCWGLLVLAWIIGAIYNALKSPTVQKRSGILSPWMIVVVLCVIASWLIPHYFWTLVTIDTLWLRVIGIVCLLLSTAFTLWARWILGKMWSYLPVTRSNHKLHTDGPYRITRHPIYTGMLGMFLGTILMNGLVILWVFLFLISIVLIEIKLRQEERLLLDTFGEQYIQYQQQVPQLIPGIKRKSRG